MKTPGAPPVVVAEFSAMRDPLYADIAVSRLQAAGIPAQRFPSAWVTGLGGPAPEVQWIRVVVPADRAEAARELLAQTEIDR